MLEAKKWRFGGKKAGKVQYASGMIRVSIVAAELRVTKIQMGRGGMYGSGSISKYNQSEKGFSQRMWVGMRAGGTSGKKMNRQSDKQEGKN